MGDSPTREVKFKATTSLEKAVTRFNSKGTDISILQDAISFEANGSYSDTGTVDVSKLKANAGISLKGLSIKDGDGPAELLRLGSFDVEDISVDGPDDIRAPLTRFKDLALLPRRSGSSAKDEPGQVLSLGDMEIAGVSMTGGSRLTVEAVQMDSLNAWVLREKGGNLEALNILEEVMETAPGTTDEGQPGESPAADGGMTAALGRFSLSGENSLTFRDVDVSPPFNYEIDSLAVEVLDLDTAPGGGPATVSVEMGMGKYSGVTMDTTIQPPWAKPDIDMNVRVNAVDLPPLTPYTSLYLGYILYSGRLDTDVDMVVEKGALNAQTEVTVNRIELEAVKEEDEQRAEERLGIPVKTALSLLKDSNDDIKLKVPVEGDLTDPQFKISDVVTSAMGQALQKGVTAYYQDLGVTLLTGGLIPPGTFTLFGELMSGATTMTFDPVTFDPMSTELDDQGRTHLDLMAEKLREKPKVRLVLCGKVTGADITSLRQADFDAALAAADAQAMGGTSEPMAKTGPPDSTGQAAEPGSAALTAFEAGTSAEVAPTGPPSIEEAPLTEDEKERLIELAKERALAVKDHLAEFGGLDPERLFVSYSHVDTDEKELPPRVDLSI